MPSGNGNGGYSAGVDSGLLISTGNTLYEYSTQTKESKELLNWIDSDLNGDNIQLVAALDDGRILVVNTDYSQDLSLIHILCGLQPWQPSRLYSGSEAGASKHAV